MQCSVVAVVSLTLSVFGNSPNRSLFTFTLTLHY